MGPIVVGVDGSAQSLEALGWATRLAEALAAEIVVVRAWRPHVSEVRPETAERLAVAHRSELEGFCGSRLDHLRHELMAVDGDPRDVLVDLAHRREAALVVVASVGASGHRPGLLAVGSVVEYLAHHLDRPLAVVPPGGAPTPASILVAVDGSEHAHAAVEWVRRFADGGLALGSITALVVDQPELGLSTGPDRPWVADAEAHVRGQLAAPLAELGVPFVPVARGEAPVPETILDVAADAGADLVVMGTRGTGGITGLRVGGVALAVLHRADRPLVLVPPAR